MTGRKPLSLVSIRGTEGLALASALAAMAAAFSGGALLSAALVFLAALFSTLAILGLARARKRAEGELADARAELENLKSREKAEMEAVSLRDKERAELASRFVSLLHRLEGLASGSADGILVLDQGLSQALEAQESTILEHGKMRKALVSYSGEVSSSSGAMRSMLESVDGLAASSKEREETIGFLLSRAEGAEERLGAIKKAVDRMIEAAGKAQGMNSLIADLSERTNLLAINASIEAAHAGQAGRGFAIVAGQIRTLSEESRKSSEAITRAIGATLGAIKETSAAAEGTGGYVREVVTDIRELAGNFESLIAELESLAAGSKQLLDSIEVTAELNAGTEAALKSSEACIQNAKESLGLVREIAGTMASDATAMTSAFRESFSEVAAIRRDLGA